MLDLRFQNETRWGELKSGDVMAQPRPVFARIEVHKEEEDVPEVAKKASKKKTKIPKVQTVAEA